MSLTRSGFLGVLALALGLTAGCKEKREIAPAPTEEPTSKARAEQNDDESASTAIKALPPEQAFARNEPTGPTGPLPLGTGVCAFIDRTYDGQDTPSTEKMVVKIKDGRVVRATYTYRGSYALDGEVDNLSLPIGEGQWTPLTLTAGGSKKEFKVKIKGKTMTFKGTAADTPEGDCVWTEKDPDETAADAGSSARAKSKAR